MHNLKARLDRLEAGQAGPEPSLGDWIDVLDLPKGEQQAAFDALSARSKGEKSRAFFAKLESLT